MFASNILEQENGRKLIFQNTRAGFFWSGWLTIDIAAPGRCGDGSIFAFSSRRAWRRLLPLSNDTSIIDFPLIRLVPVSAASLSLLLCLSAPGVCPHQDTQTERRKGQTGELS